MTMRPWPGVSDRLFCSPQAMHDIAEVIRSSSLTDDIGVPSHLARLAAEAHCHTWFSTQGLSTVVESRIGSRPGDPFSDIICSLLQYKVHVEVQREIDAQVLALHVPPLPSRVCPDFHCNNSQIPVYGNMYVDDDALLLQLLLRDCTCGI